jgi:hypothetical protein
MMIVSVDEVFVTEVLTITAYVRKNAPKVGNPATLMALSERIQAPQRKAATTLSRGHPAAYRGAANHGG